MVVKLLKNYPIGIVSMLLVIFVACIVKEEGPKHWEYLDTIALDGVNPIGIAKTSEGLWLSDGDHNRLVLLSDNWNVIRTVDSLERPMHIGGLGDTLLVPQYGNDEILELTANNRRVLYIPDSLDAPAGVAAWDAQRAIADFYNHRVLFYDGQNWLTIGGEGKVDGKFYYPTDVQITDSLIWVADAYNNRVQSFDKAGNHQISLGESEKMNAATGLFVSGNEVVVCDFEHSRILVYSERGDLKQILKQEVNKPIDALVAADTLYICNYRQGKISRYVQRPGVAGLELN